MKHAQGAVDMELSPQHEARSGSGGHGAEVHSMKRAQGAVDMELLSPQHEARSGSGGHGAEVTA